MCQIQKKHKLLKLHQQQIHPSILHHVCYCNHTVNEKMGAGGGEKKEKRYIDNNPRAQEPATPGFRTI